MPKAISKAVSAWLGQYAQVGHRIVRHSLYAVIQAMV